MALNLKLQNWFREDPRKSAARRLYSAVIDQARRPEFYGVWGVPDTATGRFDTIALHSFLVMSRLQGDDNDRSPTQAFSNTVVDDLDRNLREMGTGDLSVGKKVKQLMQGFFGRLAAYEEALTEDDAVLAATLQRNLYGSVKATDAQLSAMARYVRREAASLAEQPDDRLNAGEVLFGPPPEREDGV
jgi:cytochrome b pre-mRNA-processing protein 3